MYYKRFKAPMWIAGIIFIYSIAVGVEILITGKKGLQDSSDISKVFEIVSVILNLPAWIIFISFGGPIVYLIFVPVTGLIINFHIIWIIEWIVVKVISSSKRAS